VRWWLDKIFEKNFSRSRAPPTEQNKSSLSKDGFFVIINIININFFMDKIKIILFIFIILFGIFIFIYGGYDDSPGAQLLGFLIFISGVTKIIKSRKKSNCVKKQKTVILKN
jgi:hypothetical protein